MLTIATCMEVCTIEESVVLHVKIINQLSKVCTTGEYNNKACNG